MRPSIRSVGMSPLRTRIICIMGDPPCMFIMPPAWPGIPALDPLPIMPHPIICIPPEPMPPDCPWPTEPCIPGMDDCGGFMPWSPIP